MQIHRKLKLRIRRGDLPSTAAACLITPANDSLVDNLQPMYWRFISRKSVDGALRKLGGYELERACLDIEPISRFATVRRDITRWTQGCKEGPSAIVRCPAGSAVTTPAFGKLNADHIVHTVAPDSEFGYEGLYTGSERDIQRSGVAQHGASTEMNSRLRHESWQQFSPPDQLLQSAYCAAFAEATRLGASSVACPALGSGVKGWRHTISAAYGLEAAIRMLAPQAEAHCGGGSGPSLLQFIIGGYEPIAEKAWRSWVTVAKELLGRPSGLELDSDFREAARLGDICWELPYGYIPNTSDDTAGSVLPLLRIPDMREMLLNRQLGYSGAEVPLTPAQELRAVKRRSTR
mmetsp:Transcript_52633/g.87425  ORF Transcript_52633/g.87425 Transcript_52633/m.87425 type:complete len:348 (-) Transcript_52633:308-1351(-)